MRAAHDPSDVCPRCGMCCDGTLFLRAASREDEVEFVESLGLVVEHDDDGTVGFVLPCDHLVDGACELYAVRRPGVCSGYRCELLPAYETGAMTLDDCLDVVDQFRGLAARIEVEIGLEPGTYTATALHRHLDATRPEDDAASHQPLLATLFRLSMLGSEYFGWPRSPTTLEDAAVTARGQTTPAPAAAPSD